MLLVPMDTIETLGAIDQRCHVVFALAQIGPAETVVPALCRLLDVGEGPLANNARQTLNELPLTAEQREAFRHHPDERVRHWLASLPAE